MAALDRLIVKIDALKVALFARLERLPLVAGRGGAPAAAELPPAPPEKPFIARARDWPPPPPRPLGLDEFGLLPEAVRATLAAILEPPLARLHEAVLERLAGELDGGTPDQRVARAIAGDVAALAALIEAVDTYNAAPGSTYRIDAGLKCFLVECALGALADAAHAAVAAQRRAAAALAA